MTTRSMDEEQAFESYASLDIDSATKEGNTRPKTTDQQPVEQPTLRVLYSSAKNVSKVVEGHSGILAYRPSFLSPITLLYIIDNPLKVAVKVAHSTDTAQQHLIWNVDQQTLVIRAKASLDSLGDSRGGNGIFTFGTTCHDTRIFLLAIGRSQNERTKVAQPAASSQQNRADLMTS